MLASAHTLAKVAWIIHSSAAIPRNFERIPLNQKQSQAKEIRDRISALSMEKIER